MKKKIILSTLGVLALGAIAATTAFAFQGDITRKVPNVADAREVAMTKAITTGDYEAWKNLMVPGCKAVTVVTKEKFPQFAEMWKLEHSGNAVEAKKIRTELGLGQGMMKNGGQRNGKGGGCGQNNGKAAGCGMHKNISN